MENESIIRCFLCIGGWRLIAWILIGGRLVQTPQLATLPVPDLVIAADGGVKHATILNCPVDLWVGDFDSSDGLNLDIPCQAVPADKDFTDTELAVRIAQERGADQFIFLGAFGGRFDHMAAVLLSSLRWAEEGYNITLSSGDEWGWPLLGQQTKRIYESVGTRLSIVACSHLEGLDLEGVRWPLQKASVPLGSGWIISNEVRDEKVTMTLQKGHALVICAEPSNKIKV